MNKFGIKLRKVTESGMPLDEWTYESCRAHCGVGKDWATVYDIRSLDEGKGHATILLLGMKYYYEDCKGLKFGGSVALNERMKSIYQRCGVYEYTFKDLV